MQKLIMRRAKQDSAHCGNNGAKANGKEENNEVETPWPTG